MVATSPASTGVTGLLEKVCGAPSGTGMRVAAIILDPPERSLPAWAVAGRGRQAVLLRQADVVVCGGGHGMLAKALGAGVPAVIVPGGGDQWELANRAARQGSAVVVRPLEAAAVRSAVDTVLSSPGFAAAARAAADSARDVQDPVVVCEAAAD